MGDRGFIFDVDNQSGLTLGHGQISPTESQTAKPCCLLSIEIEVDLCLRKRVKSRGRELVCGSLPTYRR